MCRLVCFKEVLSPVMSSSRQRVTCISGSFDTKDRFVIVR